MFSACSDLLQYNQFSDVKKTEDELAEEKRILRELVEVVEQRDSLVHMLEEDRLRYKLFLLVPTGEMPGLNKALISYPSKPRNLDFYTKSIGMFPSFQFYLSRMPHCFVILIHVLVFVVHNEFLKMAKTS